MSPKIDFIVIGAQKAGTSALDSYLRQHPEIGMARRKELHFFDNDELFKDSPVDYTPFENQFETKKGIKIYGETTPAYIYWKPCIDRICQYNPQIKLIAVLRSPITRAFSHWCMSRTKGIVSKEFYVCLLEEKERLSRGAHQRKAAYLGRGFYSEQIKRIFKSIPKHQVMFLKYEEFKVNQKISLDHIFDFLKVDKVMYNFKKIDLFQGTYERKMTGREKEYLLMQFYEDICEVERLLAWDCSDWKRL